VPVAVKLSAIALDYDGTITRGDALDPSVREAVAEARQQGVVVLLVTGRTLDELRMVAGDLHFVDGIVAENGAVVHLPDNDRTTVLAPVIPEAFLQELRRLGVSFRAGRCLVDADANDAPRLLEVIRSLEQPLVLAFNRSRVMVLPQGVSKATAFYIATHAAEGIGRHPETASTPESDGNRTTFLVLRDARIYFEGAASELLASQDLYLKQFLFMTLPPW
jgi:trehalose-6-phosphatase